jgi:hypothetical protein
MSLTYGTATLENAACVRRSVVCGTTLCSLTTLSISEELHAVVLFRLLLDREDMGVTLPKTERH